MAVVGLGFVRRFLQDIPVAPGELVRLAQLAYRDDLREIAAGCSAMRWTLVRADIARPIDGRDSFVAQKNGVRVVAIAGTEINEWGDVMRLVSFFPGDPIATGVADIVRRVRERHSDLFAEWHGPMIAVGHSIGGAAAMALASFWAPLRAIGFGAPRAVKSAIARSLEGRALAIELRADPVPRIPPRPFGFASWPHRLRRGSGFICRITRHRIDAYVEEVDRLQETLW